MRDRNREKTYPLITLIGGSARVGKTTLARRLATAISTERVHLDNLLRAVSAVASSDDIATLSKAPSVDTHTPQQWLDEIRARDRVLWRAARAYVTARRGDPIIVEGGLWPDWVSQMEQEHRAVFIVDTGDSADRLVAMTHADPHSWMAERQWTEDKIRKWASYNRVRSETIAELAGQHGYPVFDIAIGMTLAQDRALRYLTDWPATT